MSKVPFCRENVKRTTGGNHVDCLSRLLGKRSKVTQLETKGFIRQTTELGRNRLRKKGGKIGDIRKKTSRKNSGT